MSLLTKMRKGGISVDSLTLSAAFILLSWLFLATCGELAIMSKSSMRRHRGLLENLHLTLDAGSEVKRYSLGRLIQPPCRGLGRRCNPRLPSTCGGFCQENRTVKSCMLVGDKGFRCVQKSPPTVSNVS